MFFSLPTKTDGFQNRKFWGISRLAVLVHQQFWYPFGWFLGIQKGIKIDGFQLATLRIANFGVPATLVPV